MFCVFVITAESKETVLLDDTETNSLFLEIEAFGQFRLIGEATSEIMENFTKISMPSIVYPYLRAFISNISIQTGLNPIILPPINFAIN